MGTKTQKLSNVVDQIVEWQSVFTGDGSTGLTAVAGRGYFINTTSGTVTVTTPASPKQGDKITIVDYAGTFATNNVTINFNGAKVFGASNTGTLATNFQVIDLIYIDSTQGWRTVNQDTTSDIQTAGYVAATGGTITTSGDYKIHTFTGDGCFVVSCAGNATGSTSVDYLVVAGGGGGGGGNDRGGGGGAGGFRASATTFCNSSPSSPRTGCVSALPVSATTYPITVGGGGAGQPSPGNGSGYSGSNSIFSTITSAGGGGGGGVSSAALSGGSGGGAAGGAPFTACNGSGNTPPVNPPQGSDGSVGSPNNPGGAGGGALAVGGTVGPTTAGTGGAGGGLPSAFGTSGQSCGGAYYFSGGGGGGAQYPAGTSSPGGVGGGGAGGPGPANHNGNPATANTGGGGGGASNQCGGLVASGGNGGKGIVVIRYKFQ